MAAMFFSEWSDSEEGWEKLLAFVLARETGSDELKGTRKKS